MADDSSTSNQPSLEQAIQQLNNIVRMLGAMLGNFSLGVWSWDSIGHNATGASGTAFTATGDQTVDMIQVSSTSGADAVTVDWVDSSAGTTHNVITDGVIGANYPLFLPGPLALHSGDTITYSGADSDMDFIITWREALT